MTTDSTTDSTARASSGKVAVITGATSGLGEAAALALAKQGHKVLVVGRDAARGHAVVKQAKDAGGEAEFLTADLFSLRDVARLAGEIRKRADHVDVLVNNAGGSFNRLENTRDGFERTFALNVAAPNALVHALLELLVASKGRVINIVTGVPHGAKATLGELVGPAAKAGLGGYIRAKLALLTLTRSWQKQYGSRGVTFVALHPGIIPGTRFNAEAPAWFRAIGEFVAKLFGLTSSTAQAAERYVRAATQPVEPGGFYYEGKLRPAPRLADDAPFTAALLGALSAPRALS